MNTNIKVNKTYLPDARLDLWVKRKRTEFVYDTNTFELVFCVNCGVDGGAVIKGCPVFFLCDNCVDKWGIPPSAIEVKFV